MKYQFAVLFFLIFLVGNLVVLKGSASYDHQDQIVIDLDQIENDGKRVEVQRYTGYENLLFRYLTLPYDISFNKSNQGRYFDIGYIIFMLFPIGLLLISYKKKKQFYLVLAGIILYFTTAVNYSFINAEGKGAVQVGSAQWDQIQNGADLTFFQSVLVFIYNVGKLISYPLLSVSDYISGESDHITYPILFLLLTATLLMVKKEFGRQPKNAVALFTMTIFFFLWLLLSGGIIWYGFLLIPILLILTFKAINHAYNQKYSISTPLKYITLSALFVWVILAYSARIANIDYFTLDENFGKSILDTKLVYYTAGIHSEKESHQFVYNRIGNTFEQINSNNNLIFQVGTSATFNITNNTKRIFHDNVLSNFFSLVKRYKDVKIILDALKASDFKYIIVDLYTPTLDKTPEQSLTKKYQIFLSMLYDSDKIKLLATDRIINVAYSSGQIATLNDVFVSNYDSKDKIKIENHGSYAIYEIL